jgi:hypothetical protein
MGCGSSYFSNWFQRVDKTQSEQPNWITPIATTTPRLEEEDAQGTFGVHIPTNDKLANGRNWVWNNTL